jgi:hypothetical protein
MQHPKMIGRILGVTFALCGLGAIAVGQQMFAAERAIEGWPTAAGHITSLDVETRDHTFTDNRGFSHRGQLAIRVVRYSFNVGARELRGEQIESPPERTDNAPVDSHYAVGQRVTIHYDPSAPDKAFLDLPLRGKGALVISIVGGVFILLAFLIPLLWNFLWRPRRDAV